MELVVFLAWCPPRFSYHGDEVVHSLGSRSSVAGELDKGFTCVVSVEAYSLVGVEREIPVQLVCHNDGPLVCVAVDELDSREQRPDRGFKFFVGHGVSLFSKGRRIRL